MRWSDYTFSTVGSPIIGQVRSLEAGSTNLNKTTVYDELDAFDSDASLDDKLI